MTQTSPTQPGPGRSGPPSSRRRWRWIVGGIGALLVLILVLVLLLPTLLSGPMRGTVVSAIDQRIAGSVSIDGLDLAWFGGQRIDGLTLTDDQGQRIMHVRQLDLPEASLWSLVRGNLNLGSVNLDVQDADIVQYEDGSTNLGQALSSPGSVQMPDQKPGSPPSRSGPPQWPSGLSVQLAAQADRVRYSAPDMEPVVLSDTKLDLDARDPRQLVAKLVATLQQGASTGQLRADLTAADAFDADGYMQQDQARVQANADVNNVPAAAVDRLLQQRGKLEALLGQRVDARIQATGKLRDLQVNFTATSETLNANILASTRDNAIVVADSTIELLVTPPAWEQWIAARSDQPQQGPGMTLVQPFTVNLAIQRLALPAESFDNFEQVAAQLQGEVGDIVLDSGDAQLGQVALRQTQFQVQSQSLRQGLTARMSAIPEQADRRGALQVDANLTNLLDDRGALALQQATVQADVAADQLPVALVDELAAQQGLLLAALGDSIDVNVQARGQAGGDQLTATITAQSQHLRSNLNARMQGQTVLVSDSTVDWTLTPAAWQKLELGTEQATLQKPAPIRLTIQSLTLPAQSMDDLSAVAAQLSAQMPELLLQTRDVGAVALQQTQLTVNTLQLRDGLNLELTSTPVLNNQPGALKANVQLTNLLNNRGALQADRASAVVQANAQRLPVALVDQLAKQDGLLVDAVGPSLDARVNANLQPAPGGTRQGSFTVIAQSAQLNANLAGELTDDAVQVQQGSRMDLAIQPALFGRLVSQYVEPQPGDLLHNAALRQPAQVQVNVQSLRLPRPFDAQQLAAQLQVTLRQLMLVGDPRLAATFGPQLDQVDINLTKSPQQTEFTALIRDEELRGDLRGQLVQGQSLRLADTTVQYLLTPAALEAWTRPAEAATGSAAATPPMRLLQPARVDLTLANTIVPMKPEGGADLPNASLAATLRSEPLMLAQQGKPPVAVRDLQVALQSRRLGELLEASAQALFEVQGAAAGQAPGQLKSNNRLANLFNAQGELDILNADIVMDTQLQDVPVDALDALLGLSTMLGLDGQLSEVTGTPMRANLQANAKRQGEGTLDLQVQAPHLQMNVPASISAPSTAQDGQTSPRLVKLREDATATLAVQPGLARQVLAKINPIFVNALEAKDPVQLSVDHRSFAAPLDDFEIGKLRADASLTMGTLTLGRGGMLDVLLGLLKAGRGQTSQAIISPLHVHVQDGVLRYNRFDIEGRPQLRDMMVIVDGLTLGFQGQVNLLTQRVNLETAFYADSLNRLLGQSVQFGPNDVLVIPMTGSSSAPKLATDELYRQIARLGGTAALRGAAGEEAAAILGGLEAVLGGSQSSGGDRGALLSAAARRPPDFQIPQTQVLDGQAPPPGTIGREPSQAAPSPGTGGAGGAAPAGGLGGLLEEVIRGESGDQRDRQPDQPRREQRQQEQVQPQPQQQEPAPKEETRKERRERRRQERQEQKQEQQQ